MRKAFFYKKYKYIEFFDSHNTTICKPCDDLKQARLIVKSSNIEQELKVVK